MMLSTKTKTLVAKTLILIAISLSCLVVLGIFGTMIYGTIVAGAWYIFPILSLIIGLVLGVRWANEYLEMKKLKDRDEDYRKLRAKMAETEIEVECKKIEESSHNYDDYI